MVNILTLQRKYKLDPIELACVSIFMQTGDKTFAWSYTVGRDSQSKNKTILAGQWFRQERVQRFLFDHNDKKEKEEEKEVKRIDSDLIIASQSIEATKKEVEQTFGIIEDVTSENIKQLFINELNCSKDPEKRAALLLKLSDTLELITPEETDLLTPIIYLPERCQSCKFKQATKE